MIEFMALALVQPIVAPDAEPEQAGGPVITVTATRSPRRTDEVPATVTVIDDERIADELASDVRDLVRFEPGVSVPRAPARFSAALGATGRDQNSSFRIRGIGGNRVLIQVDGIRVPDGFSFGAQAAGRGDYVDLGIVRSVEILRGPASALYGSDGLAGAVSFQTSDPADLLRGGENVAAMLRAAYDSASDEFTETGLVAGQSGRWSALASYTRRDGHELDNQGEVGGQGAARTQANPQDTSSNALLAKLVYAPDDAHRLRLTGEYGSGFVDTDLLSTRSATTLDIFARDSTRRQRLSLDWRYNGEGILRFAQVAAYAQRGENRQFTFEDRTPAVDRSRINTFDNEVIGASGEARLRFETGAIVHNFVFGGDYSRTRQEGIRDGTVPPAGEVFPTRAFPVTDFTLAGLFLTDEIELFDGRLIFYPAVRFDAYSLDPEDDSLLPTFQASAQDGSRLTPRVGAVARLFGGVSVYGNYASGFKAPSPSQVNNFFENLTSPFFSYRSIPNPDLEPETSETFEAGLRYTSDIFTASLAAFTGTYENFISQQQISGTGTIANPIIFQFVNLSGVEIDGIEGKASLVLRNGITADLAFAYADGDSISATGVAVPLSTIDPLKIVGGIGYRDPGGRFGAQVYVTYNARKELDETVGVCAPACFRPDESTVLDLTAFFRVNDAITIRGGVFNLTDERYALWSDVVGLALVNTAPAGSPPVLVSPASAPAFTQPGRYGRVSVTLRF